MNQYLSDGSVYLGQNWYSATSIIVKESGKTEIKANEGWAGPEKMSKTLGGLVLGMPDREPAPRPRTELAMKFWQYLTSKEVQEKLASGLGWLSVRTDVQESVEEWRVPYFEVAKESLKYASPPPRILWRPKLDKALSDALREIADEGANVESTLDKYHDVIEEARE